MVVSVNSFDVSPTQTSKVTTKSVKDSVQSKTTSIDSNEESNHGKKVAIGAGLAALASVGLYIASKGKAKSVINTNPVTVKPNINRLIRQTEENIVNAERRFASQGARTASTDRAVVEQMVTTNANNNSRKIVERALRETPTESDIARYHEKMKYKPARAEDVAGAKAKGVKFVEKEGANATQSVADTKGASALSGVKTSIESGSKIKNGTYSVEYADGKIGTYTVKDGAIVKSEIPELSGKITDLKLAKHHTKYNILEQIAQGGSNVKLV